MIALGLDLGTDCGIALWDGAGHQCWTVHLARPNAHESPGMRYIRLRKALNEIRGAYAIDVVFYEEVRRHAGTRAAHVYGGYLATLQAWCTANEIEMTGVSVTRVKRFATGKGNASKEAMIAAAKQRFADVLVNDDHNRADALFVLAVGLNDEVGSPLENFYSYGKGPPASDDC